MIIDDTVVIAAAGILTSAIAAMWVYYNKRITSMEARIAKLEADRLSDYKAHLAAANKLAERCAAAIDRFTDSFDELKAELKGNK